MAMAAQDLQFALYAHLNEASLASSPEEINKHLEAFTRDWKKEPSLEQFGAALGLLRDSKRSPNAEAVSLWWLDYIQDICISDHIGKYSSELHDALLKAAGEIKELAVGASGPIVKRALQVCSTIYPFVFLICCQDSAAYMSLWNEYGIGIKLSILGRSGDTSDGYMISRCKFIQTIIQTQSYSQPNSTPQDTETYALNKIPPNHPFLNAEMLANESDGLLQHLLSIIRSPTVSSTVVTAVINQTSALQRARPQFIPLVLGTWMSFIKPSLPSHFSPLQARFTEKAIRIQLLALTKMQLQPSQLQIVVEALSGYGIRYNGGTLSRQQQQQLLHVDKDSGDDSKRSGKRSRSSNQESDDIDMKRLKSEQDIGANTPPSVTSGAPPPPLPGSTSDSAQPPGIPPGFGQTLLGQINITQLPLHHVVDIIFESLAANNVPHLFHSFLSTLHLLRLKEGPLPMPPPGVGPPPPGFVPPPLPPEMMPSLPSGMLPLPQPHMLPPHLAGAPGAQPPAPPVVESKAEIKPEIKKEANFSKLQLPRIPDNVQVNITVLPPNHTPTQLPRRPMVVKSDTTTNVPRKDTPSEKNVKAEPKKESDEVQRLKQETFQVRPFEPSAEIPGKHASLVPARKLLEQTFERILGSEHVVSVPGVSGRKMLEAAASHQAGQRPKRDESGAVVPFGHGDAAGYPAKVVTKADWMSIVSRLLTRAFTRESGASEGTASAVDKGVKERMVDYICKDFKQRRELALTWLHEEWYYDGICQREAADMDDREPQYLWCLYKILDGITSGSTQLDLRDRGLTRFLLEVPELPDGAVDIIQKYCDDPARAQLGMACLRDVVNLRPPSRARALEILLSYTTHPEKAQRSMAIVTAKKWYLEHPTVGVKVEEYALAQLETLKDYPVPKRDAVIPVPNEDSNKKGDVDTPMTEAGPRIKTEVADESMVVNNNDNNSSNNRAKSASLEPPSGSTPSSTSKSLSTLAIDKAFLQAEEDIGNLLELYLSLCAKNHALLEVLFRNYISYDPFVQRVIRQKIQPLIKSIKSDSTKLLALIRDFPMGAEMLVLRIIVILTDGVQPSPGLVSAVQDAVIKHDLNARFLIPIIGGLDREAVFNCLPRIVGLLKGTERERRTVTDVFLKLLTGSGRSGGPGQTTSSALSTGSDRRTSNVSAIATTTSSSSLQSSSSASRGPIMSPSELLIELHAIEDTVGWKAACEAMDICFNHPEIYKSEIIAVVLQQLLEQPTIPSLFMRTVIQAITLYKNLVGFVNSMILAKLIPKKVWSRKVLWKGFVRCAKMTQPSSSSVLASLPKPQLKEVLAMEPSLKEPVEAFIKAKSSGRRVGGGAAKQVSVLSVPSSDVVPNTIPTSTPAPTLAINPASSPAAVSTSSAATATIAASIQPDIAIENEVKKEYPSEMDTTVSSTPMDI